MALFVTYNAADHGQMVKKVIQIHIGEQLPSMRSYWEEEIIMVQADCDELDYIIANFPSVPLAYHTQPSISSGSVIPASRVLNRVQKWFGDDAKFIYHNLQWNTKSNQNAGYHHKDERCSSHLQLNCTICSNSTGDTP